MSNKKPKTRRKTAPTLDLVLREGLDLYRRLVPTDGEIDPKNGLAVLRFLAEQLSDGPKGTAGRVVFLEDLVPQIESRAPRWGGGVEKDSTDFDG